MGVANLNPKAE
ncbi:hypothetical protein A2U01_0084667, partial [Trifolium medium]|nr:hypothetical protein [Trifolium medium]